MPVPANGEADRHRHLRHALLRRPCACSLHCCSLLALPLRGPGAGDRHLAGARPGRGDRLSRPRPRRRRAAQPRLARRLCPDQRDPARAPPGRGQRVRFEGVAGGHRPAKRDRHRASARRCVEKNRDAQLLSPGSLLDALARQRVHLRRTSRATGEVREQEAVDPLERRRASCSRPRPGSRRCAAPACPRRCCLRRGARRICRPSRPCRSASAARSRSSATVTLSYIANDFDWQANYVARRCRPTGDRVDLFAWLTLANGDETGFADADTQAVAGKLNREARLGPAAGEAQADHAQLLAAGHDQRHSGSQVIAVAQPPSPPPPPAADGRAAAPPTPIVVTGSRVGDDGRAGSGSAMSGSTASRTA